MTNAKKIFGAMMIAILSVFFVLTEACAHDGTDNLPHSQETKDCMKKCSDFLYKAGTPEGSIHGYASPSDYQAATCTCPATKNSWNPFIETYYDIIAHHNVGILLAVGLVVISACLLWLEKR